MKDIAYKSIKTALVFIAIGAIVAVAMPGVMGVIAGMGVPVAADMTAHATAAAVIHMASVFGLFGAMVPIFEPLFDLFFKKSPSEETAAATVKATSGAKQVYINIQQAPQQAQGTLVDVDTAKFRQKIETDRAVAAASQLIPPTPTASI